MSQPCTVTITGKTGPGYSVTSQVFTNVIQLIFDYIEQTVAIVTGAKDANHVFQLDDIATVTYTISSGTAAVVIST